MKFLLTACLSICVLFVSAQNTTKRFDHKAALSISPLALVDVDNGIMLGGEYRFNARYALVMDASYLFQSYYLTAPKDVSGFTVRPALRFYTGKKEGREFFQVQAFYKQVDYTFYGWIDKNIINGVPSYSQLQDYIYNKEVWGVNFMAGYLETFSSGRFYLDLAGGIGLRLKRQGVAEPNSRIQQRRNIGIYKEKMTTFSLPFNIKLAYALNRR
jgi:Protein of unknown function (DUF3575)